MDPLIVSWKCETNNIYHVTDLILKSRILLIANLLALRFSSQSLVNVSYYNMLYRVMREILFINLQDEELKVKITHTRCYNFLLLSKRDHNGLLRVQLDKLKLKGLIFQY